MKSRFKNMEEYEKTKQIAQEAELAEFKSFMLTAEIHMQAMIAENKQREILGEQMAYNEKHFIDLITDYNLTKVPLIRLICPNDY